MCVVVRYVICYYFRFLFVCEVVFAMSFMAKLVGRGRFVFGWNFVFCVGMGLCFDANLGGV